MAKIPSCSSLECFPSRMDATCKIAISMVGTALWKNLGGAAAAAAADPPLYCVNWALGILVMGLTGGFLLDTDAVQTFARGAAHPFCGREKGAFIPHSRRTAWEDARDYSQGVFMVRVCCTSQCASFLWRDIRGDPPGLLAAHLNDHVGC